MILISQNLQKKEPEAPVKVKEEASEETDGDSTTGTPRKKDAQPQATGYRRSRRIAKDVRTFSVANILLLCLCVWGGGCLFLSFSFLALEHKEGYKQLIVFQSLGRGDYRPECQPRAEEATVLWTRAQSCYCRN